MRRLLSSILAVAAILSQSAAFAQGQPASWRYQMSGGVSTATYPGIVNAEITTSTASIDVRAYGAMCDNGATDDTVAIQAALTYAGTLSSAQVTLPANGLCKVSSTLTMGQGVSLVGQGYVLKSGLMTGAVNLNPMIYVNGDGAQVRNMYINASAAGANSSGVMIKTGIRTQIKISDLYITGSCGALSVNGNLHDISNVYAFNSQGVGCSVITVGEDTTLSGSTNIKFDHVQVTSVNNASRPTYCWDIKDAGGLMVTASDGIYCNTGTVIRPGANQQVIWATFSDTYLGDTNASHAAILAPQAVSAVIRGFSCSNCWASSSVAGNGILVQNGAPGQISDLNFVGLRALGNANGVEFQGTTASIKATIANSQICGYSGSGVNLGANVIDVTITGSEIRPNCMGLSGAGTIGVLLNGSNANIILSDLNLQNNATPGAITGIPTGASAVTNVLGVTTSLGSIASAAALNLNAAYEMYTLTGTTGVTSIAGGWNNRKVTFFPSGVVTFTAGATICNSITTTANVPVIATFNGTCWALN